MIHIKKWKDDGATIVAALKSQAEAEALRDDLGLGIDFNVTTYSGTSANKSNHGYWRIEKSTGVTDAVLTNIVRTAESKFPNKVAGTKRADEIIAGQIAALLVGGQIQLSLGESFGKPSRTFYPTASGLTAESDLHQELRNNEPQQDQDPKVSEYEVFAGKRTRDPKEAKMVNRFKRWFQSLGAKVLNGERGMKGGRPDILAGFEVLRHVDSHA